MSQGLDYSETGVQSWIQASWTWLQRQPWPLRVLLLLIVYLSLGLLLEVFADRYGPASYVQPWDPASGLHIVLLFGFGLRYAPAIFFVPFLEDAIWSTKEVYYLFGAISALYICIGYAGAAYFLLRYQKIDPRLRSLKDMLWFAMVFLGVSLVISGLSLLTQQVIAAPLDPDWAQKWMHDWAGEANGIMMIAPPCLLLMRLFPWSQRRLSLQGDPPQVNLTKWLRQNPIERTALVGGTVLSAWLAYGGLQGNSTEFSYLTFIPVIWVAIKWGLGRTTVCLLVLNVFSVIFASSGRGSDNDVLAIQFGLLTVTTVGALLGSYVTDYRLELDFRQRLENELRYQATHDSLTGLYSRVFFRQQLDKLGELEDHLTDESVLLFIDVDRFKAINDSLGHLVGDRLLSSIAHRIEYSLSEKLTPKTFSACRFGGDEFVVLIMPTTLGQATTKAGSPQASQQKMIEALARDLCDCLAEVYEVEGYKLSTTVSIGIAFSSSIHKGPEDLLRNADIALYKAKAAGRGQYTIFNHQMYEELVERSQLERDLNQAVLQIDDSSVGANG